PRSPNSELGPSCAESTKVRRMLESYTDRVYICKSYSGVGDPQLRQDTERRLRHLDTHNLAGGPFFDDPLVAHHTAYCHLVRPVDDLISDLARWKQEIPAAE
ncbi:MAG: hypothetical protein HW416_2586, partial [Chloroflexi bacterium]|nr:hypothetical protein [Chloroflexota bacterium]